MPLVKILVSNPKVFKKPAHSSATYDPPMTNVLPGGLFRVNKSSLVI